MENYFNNFQYKELKTNTESADSNSKSIDKGDIAIIGMSVKLPQAETVEAFWSNCINGVDCVVEFPEKRKKDSDNYLRFIGEDVELLKYKKGAFLDEIDGFDYSFFKFPPKEANIMNPYQRMFLEKSWEALEDAGYGTNEISGSKTGVFVGYIADLEGFKYNKMVWDSEGGFNPLSVTGNLASITPSRISYLMNLRGPSMLVDTACSSSLVAVHMACESIRSGTCNMALAGGVKAYFSPIEGEANIGIESSDGKTKAFDDYSDGTGIGEGLGVVVLKSLEDALNDKDNIHAVIKGTAINQDGASAGITAPNVAAQTDLIVEAWENANIDPETIAYIEAHGTGTKIGDPIEIEGISNAFKFYTDKKQFCGIGSVKSNVGHLYEAAGIIGLIKSALVAKHGVVPPSLHVSRPNRRIAFEHSPVYINNVLSTIEDADVPTRTGVSSFGFSGTNCHIVLEQPPRVQSTFQGDNHTKQVFKLSAKSEKALSNYITKYIDWIGTTSASLEEVCFTANTTRSDFEYRLAVVCSSLEDLKAKLKIAKEACFTNEVVKNIYYSHQNESVNQLESYFGNSISDADYICGNYVKNHTVIWKDLYKDKNIQKVSVPTYPFSGERCWVEFENDSDSGTSRKSVVLKNGSDDSALGQVEQAVSEIWSTVLGYKEIDANKSLFDLGADSISIVKISNLLNETFKVNIGINELFEKNTVSKMAVLISSKSEGTQVKKRVSRAPDKDFYETSPAQKRMFVMQENDHASTAYNVVGAVEIIGALDKSKLENAFIEMIKRHEGLRTSFHIVDGQIVQKIHEANETKFELNEVSVSNETELLKVMENAIMPFNLEKTPLFKISLYNLSENRSILLIDIHHIISDVSSMRIFTEELSKIYSNLEIASMENQYRDYVEWHTDFKLSDEYRNQKAYWLDEFSETIPKLNLPTDYERGALKENSSDQVVFEIDRSITAPLQKIARDNETTMYMVLLTCLKSWLSKHCFQDDIVIGSPIACRNNIEFESIIGIMMNTIALKSKIDKHKSFAENLNHVKVKTLSAYRNQDYQFDELVQTLNIDQDKKRNPLFDVMFVLQEQPTIRLDGLTIKEYEIPNRNSMLDLTIVANNYGDNIRFTVTFREQLFKKASIVDMTRRFKLLMEKVADGSDLTIDSIQLLDERELQDYQSLVNSLSDIDDDFNF